MRKYLLLLAAAALLAAPKPALAYTATTGINAVINGDNDASGNASAGDTFTVANGTFATFTPNEPDDPQINNNDLARFKYNILGTVASVAGTDVRYGGSAQIYYDLNDSGVFDAGTDFNVAGGPIDLLARYGEFGSLGYVPLTGTLIQVTGPDVPDFAPLGPIVMVDGRYNPDLQNPLQGTFQATLTQTGPGGVIPEPGTIALLGAGLLPLLGLRRRK